MIDSETIKIILRTMDKAANETGFEIALIDKTDGSIIGFDKLLSMVDGAFAN